MHTTSNSWAQIDENPSPAAFISFLDRLNAMHSVRSYKQRTLDLLHALPGDTVLDIGCGTGDDARALAAIVGDGGHVTGIDRAVMVAEAQKRSKSTDSKLLTFEQGDAHDLQFANDSFDRCRTDRVLQHVDDPSKVLSEMLRVLKAGGRATVSEPDWGTLVIDSADVFTTRAVVSTVCDGIRNGWIGRRLPSLFEAAGFQDLVLACHTLVFTDYTLANHTLNIEAAAHGAAKQGVINEDQGAAWLRRLQHLSEHGKFFAAITGFAVSGRKPQQ
jgi:ubiquinone/menaquinone biosynthesis C-methylase UbiE